MSLIRMLLVAGALASPPLGAHAEEARLGALQMTVDPARWRVVRSNDAELQLWHASKNKPAIHIRQTKGVTTENCTALADFGSHYDTAKTEPTQVAGQPALRLQAHSRCRNRVSPAIAYCVAWGGDIYLARTAAVSCRSGVPWPAAEDAMHEIAATFRFVP